MQSARYNYTKPPMQSKQCILHDIVEAGQRRRSKENFCLKQAKVAMFKAKNQRPRQCRQEGWKGYRAFCNAHIPSIHGKNRSQKVLALQKSTRIRLTGVPVQARNAICQARVDRMPSTCWGKKQNVGGGEEESGLWKDKLGGDANPAKIC